MPEDLFKYVGLMVMAEQDGTTVTIDLDGPGPTLPFTVTLNQGQSYLVNGGVMRGGTVSSSLPVEVNLICGDTVHTYAMDWFTLYPESEWSSSYYTPVPSAYGGATLYTTINYFYNTTSNPITVLCSNLNGFGTITIPANGGTEYPMPTNSGASFTSAAGENFTVLTTAAANATNDPTGGNDTDYNWGYTPLPAASLTTEAQVGWAPGSSDYTTNGNPVWVTTIGNTTIYVIYPGTNNAQLTDPYGGKYSTNFTLTSLQSQPIFVSGTNNSQTGLILYTLDNTLFSTAWGEDPAKAPSGNPGLDCGYAVLPFPVPRLTKIATIVTDVPPAGLSTGDTIQYTVTINNKGLLPLGNTVVIDTPTASLSYVSNSTTLDGVPIPDGTNGNAFPLGSPGYTIPVILSQGTSVFQYDALVVGAGNGVSNSINISGTTITASNAIPYGYDVPAPNVSVYKTIVSPATNTVGVGQVVEFNLQVIDTGNTTLTNLALVDNFPSNVFSFVSAGINVSKTNAGSLLWTNLGSFVPGQSTNVNVFLKATNTSALATNFMIASSQFGATNTNSVTIIIAPAPAPGISASKTIISPMSGTASVGQTVQFNLQVFNSGYTTLTNISLVDSYPSNDFSFVSASVSPNTNAPGRLNWTNIGTFAPGQFTNITVSLMVTNYLATLTNSMTAASVGGATNSSSVILDVTRGALTITKSIINSNGPVDIGSNIVYQLLIKNTGLIPIKTIPLEDTYGGSFLQYVSATIPPNTPGVGDLYWTNLVSTPLAVGATITNDVTMEVVGVATPAINTATVDSAVDTNGVAVAPASSSIGINTVALGADMAIGKSGAAGVFANTNFSYTISVTNLGPLAASGVVVTDTLPLGVTFVNASGGGTLNGNVVSWILGSMTVAEVSNLTLTVTAPASGTLTNTANVSSPTLDTNLVNNTSPPVITTVTPVADLAIGKSGALGVRADTNFSYAITVTNLGPSMASGVVVTDTLPVGVTFVSASGGGTLNGNTVSWSLETMTSAEVSNLTLTVTAPASGTLTNTANVSSPTLDTNLVNNTSPPVITTVTPVADLAIGKSGVTGVQAGTNFNYTITVTNFGPSSASGVVVTDTLPVGVTYLSASGGGTLNGNVVSWSLGSLTMSQVSNLTLTVRTPASGTLTNTAVVSSLTLDTNLVNNTSPPVITTVTPVADLAISKSGPAASVYGNNLGYTISVTNIGPSVAVNLSVTDSLPAGLAFVSSVPVTTTNAGNQVIWTNLGSLISGAATNLTLTVHAITSGTVSNFASVGSPTYDPNLTNNVTPPVVTIISQALPSVTWGTPTNIVYGTALGTNQNDATATIGGTFSYNPTNGVVLDVGTNTLSVIFTPASTNYAATNLTVELVVTPAPLTITAGNQGKLYGTTLNLGTTNFTTSGLVNGDTVSGVTLTSAGSGSAAPEGTYPIIPSAAVGSDLTNYTISYDNGTLNVGLGVYSASWGTPTNIVYGTALGTNQNDATATIGGTFSYNPTNGVVLDVGTNTLSVIFTPASTNYAATNLTVELVVTPAPLTITAGNQGKLYGTTLNLGTTNFTASGLVNGDTVSGVTLTSAGSGSAAPEGTYPIIPSAAVGSDLTNYTITYDNGTLNVIAVADLAVGKSGPAGVEADTNFSYTITVTNLGPSTASGVVITDTLPVGVTFVSASGGGTHNGGVVSWSLGSLVAEQVSNLTLMVTAPASGTLTNKASVSSSTLDTNLVNNTSLPVITTVIASGAMADIQVYMYGPTNVTVGDEFSYIIMVTNAGPSSAADTVAKDTLPTNLVFYSASGGGTLSNNVVTWPVIALLANGQATNLIINVAPSTLHSTNLIGSTPNPLEFIMTNTYSAYVTNIASAFSTTFDPNLTNNNGTLPVEQVQTLIVPGVFSVLLNTNVYPSGTSVTNTIIPIGSGLYVVGTSAFDPQTGFFEESVTVTNIGSAVVHALRLYIGNLPGGVSLYNATGTNNGVPYVEYDPPYNTPILPYPIYTTNCSVTFVLEFYVSNREQFTNSLTAVAIVPPTAATMPAGTVITSTITPDNRNPSDVRYLITFNSVPGRTYSIEYSDDDMVTWNIAVPSIVASANVTQWYDDGPPETDSKPITLSSRFYRVILQP
jgi:uncharacterized repeat protein (TIGR01451 family)